MTIEKPSELWERYRAKVYGSRELPRQQVKECRNAFLGGMQAMFIAMNQLTAPDEDQAVELLDSYLDLLKAEALSENPTGES